MEGIFKKGLECSDVEKYTKKIGKEEISNIVDEMEKDYVAKETEREKILMEYRLKDIINDIDKTSFISFNLALITPIISNTFIDDKKAIVAILTIFYFFISRYIIIAVRYHRCCKLYLDVIADIKNRVSQ